MKPSMIEKPSKIRCAGARAFAAMLVSMLAAGCGTTIEDAVPGANRTGTYPNINIPQQAATEQLTNEEAQAGIAAVSAARQAQEDRGSDDPQSEAERLERLRQVHGGQALEEIEG